MAKREREGGLWKCVWVLGGPPEWGGGGQIPRAERPGCAKSKQNGQGCLQLDFEGLSLPSNRKDEGQGRILGTSLCSAVGPLGTGLGAEGGEDAQAELLDSHLPSCTQNQEWGAGPSSGQDPGLPWPQSRTGDHRSPNSGDVKLAAGKSIQASSLLWVPISSLFGCQAMRTPNPRALPGPWGTPRLPLPIGKEAAPGTSNEVGQGTQGVNGGVARVH